MKTIPLTQGYVAIVDDEDFERLAAHRWYAGCIDKNWYAMRHDRTRPRPRIIYMHREVNGALPGQITDHKDNNGLNNCRSNLRLCTHAENMRNCKKHKAGTSRFVGVSYSKKERKWIAAIQDGGKYRRIGGYPFEFQAACPRREGAGTARGLRQIKFRERDTMTTLTHRACRKCKSVLPVADFVEGKRECRACNSERCTARYLKAKPKKAAVVERTITLFGKTITVKEVAFGLTNLEQKNSRRKKTAAPWPNGAGEPSLKGERMSAATKKTKAPSVTITQILSWGPCGEYSDRERLIALGAGRRRITAIEILDLDIPATDRMWAVFHGDLMTDFEMYECACRFAERALLAERAANREPDPRSWAAIETRRAWMRGEATDEQLLTAWSTASAGWSAAWWSAASAAGWSAAAQLQIIREVLSQWDAPAPRANVAAK